MKTPSIVAVVALACILMLLSLSCGAMTVGMSLNDGSSPYSHSYWDAGPSHYDGVWWGNYVWYHGDWRYLGYGTPYYYDSSHYYWQ